MNNNNVTPISDLPSLEDLEGGQRYQKGAISQYTNPSSHPSMSGGDILPPHASDKIYEKHIRKSHDFHDQSGMVDQYQPRQQNYNEQPPPPPPSQQKYYNEQLYNQHSSQPLTCMDCVNHIESCPICTKFYGSDTTMYILAIVILSVVCLLLLKKVLKI